MPDSSIDPAAAAAIRRDLADLHEQVRTLKRLQSVGRLWTWGTVVIVVLMFGLFSWATYSKISRNFDQASIQRAVKEHGDQVLPMATQMLTQTGQTLLPVYKDAAVATLKTQGPAAAQAAVARIKRVPEQSGKEFQEKVAAAFDSAVKKVEPDFKAAYPNVTDAKRQDLLKSFVADQITAQNKRVAAKVDQLYTNDLIHMQTTLEKFDTPKATAAAGGGGASNASERKFLLTMVDLLRDRVDDALSATGGKAGADADPATATMTAGMRSSPTTMPATQPAAAGH